MIPEESLTGLRPRREFPPAPRGEAGEQERSCAGRDGRQHTGAPPGQLPDFDQVPHRHGD